jgi:hypothetical protein
MNLEPKEYSAGIVFDRKCLETPKIYGSYTRNGKKFIRKYGHVLKNGKGMSFIEMLNERFHNRYERFSFEFGNIFADEAVVNG